VPEQAVWLTEDDVAELLTIEDAIEVLAGSYRLRAQGTASAMRRAHVRSGEAILHAVGGTLGELAGTKTWTYTPHGAAPLLILFSLVDGSIKGIVEAFAMGQMRTAATSGLATRVLAQETAGSLALIGSGKQAFSQALAIACVRPLREIRVFGRSPEKRMALARRLNDSLGIETTSGDSPAEAIAGASIVTLVTRAADPIVTSAMLEPGQHVNAVGAIVPSRRELDESAVARCDVILADSVDQAREDAGELRAAAEAGVLDWNRVQGLDSIVDAPSGAVRGDRDVTLFKAVGLGLSDVALGAELIRRAHQTGVGRPLPQPALTHAN
jgi:ornithine cyclodeaminase